MALLISLMDHPGLLFGFRDPTLRHSYNADAKEFTDEYTVCLTQRLLSIATCNSTFRAKALENITNATSPHIFNEQISLQHLAIRKGVKDSLFLVSQLIPDLPTSIVKEPFEFYEFVGLVPLPMYCEPDEDVNAEYLKQDQDA